MTLCPFIMRRAYRRHKATQAYVQTLSSLLMMPVETYHNQVSMTGGQLSDYRLAVAFPPPISSQTSPDPSLHPMHS